MQPVSHALTVAVGDAGNALHVSDRVLSLGAHHPAQHGLIRLRLQLSGFGGDEVITAAEPVIGYVHRGVEKLFEVRDYRQILALADRHDWLGAAGSEIGVALAVERMLGLEVPVRATWLRTLLSELMRITSHLAFLGSFPAADAAALPAHAARERLIAVLEGLTGGRMHVMFTVVGGVREDVPSGWLDELAAVTASVRAALPLITPPVQAAAGASTGVGRLDPAVVLQYGVSGPPARASGIDLDLRRDDPSLAYAELTDVLRVSKASAGDVPARMGVLLDQVSVSLDLVDACAERLRILTGPVNVRLPKIVKVPEGSTYLSTENPLGSNGYLLVSRGDKVPWRLKLRTASFGNLSSLPALLPGCRLSDLRPVLASVPYVVGDTDR
jgi:NADH-quinone oxidoreductase subunit D